MRGVFPARVGTVISPARTGRIACPTRLLLILAIVIAAACDNETVPVKTERNPIAIQYVRANELQVHKRPSDDSPVVTEYANGESVSVLSRRKKWSEIRTPDGSGWVHGDDLSSAVDAKKAEADNLTPRFRVTPEPVSQPGAFGEIVLVADVNSDGEVTSVTTQSNTTGSKDLELKNTASLRRARFYPIVRHGQRTPFTYEHRVHY